MRLRSFTPAGAEVGGAGHNALGAWVWLDASGRLGPLDRDRGFRQEIAGQVLQVEVMVGAVGGTVHLALQAQFAQPRSPLDGSWRWQR